MDANIAGLVINFIGAIVLLISSRSQNHVLAKLFNQVIHNSSHGLFEAKPSVRAELERDVKTRGWLSLIGLVLFVIGFGLQIICLQFNCFQ